MRSNCKSFFSIIPKQHHALQSVFGIISFRLFSLFTGSAAKVFETLKKKYSRKRVNLRKSSRSGVGTRDLEKAKKELEEYSFLRWLDAFVRPRKTKSNMPEASLEINKNLNVGHEVENDSYDSEESEGVGLDALNNDTESFTTLEESTFSKKCEKEQVMVKQKPQSFTQVNQADIMRSELDVMGNMLKIWKQRLTSLSDEKQDDEDDLFGKLVAAELKKLPEWRKYRLKHEINNLIYNYKLQNENDVTEASTGGAL